MNLVAIFRDRATVSHMSCPFFLSSPQPQFFKVNHGILEVDTGYKYLLLKQTEKYGRQFKIMVPSRFQAPEWRWWQVAWAEGDCGSGGGEREQEGTREGLALLPVWARSSSALVSCWHWRLRRRKAVILPLKPDTERQNSNKRKSEESRAHIHFAGN